MINHKTVFLVIHYYMLSLQHALQFGTKYRVPRLERMKAENCVSSEQKYALRIHATFKNNLLFTIVPRLRRLNPTAWTEPRTCPSSHVGQLIGCWPTSLHAHAEDSLRF